MNEAKCNRKEMEEIMEALNGYLESLSHIEILYSQKRGYIVLRWDTLLGAYYGIDAIETPEQMALYIYTELIDRITVETKTDHNLQNMNFNEMELAEARAITQKFLALLPADMKERFCKKLDSRTGLILDKEYFVKGLLS